MATIRNFLNKKLKKKEVCSLVFIKSNKIISNVQNGLHRQTFIPVLG